jgi:hypothetical protein
VIYHFAVGRAVPDPRLDISALDLSPLT